VVSSFYLLSFFPHLISAVADWVSTILPHSDALDALPEACCTQCIILHPLTLPYDTALAYCEISSLKLWQINFQKKNSWTAGLSSWKLPAPSPTTLTWSLSFCETVAFCCLPHCQNKTITARSFMAALC